MVEITNIEVLQVVVGCDEESKKSKKIDRGKSAVITAKNSQKIQNNRPILKVLSDNRSLNFQKRFNEKFKNMNLMKT